MSIRGRSSSWPVFLFLKSFPRLKEILSNLLALADDVVVVVENQADDEVVVVVVVEGGVGTQLWLS